MLHFAGAVSRWEVENSIRSLGGDLRRARAEAIRRGGVVEVSPVATGDGYHAVWTPPGRSPIEEWKDEGVVSEKRVLFGRSLVTGTRLSTSEAVAFRSDGSMTGGPLRLVVDSERHLPSSLPSQAETRLIVGRTKR